MPKSSIGPFRIATGLRHLTHWKPPPEASKDSIQCVSTNAGASQKFEETIQSPIKANQGKVVEMRTKSFSLLPWVTVAVT